MRTEAKLHNQNLVLEDKIIEQQEEIRQLRTYLRALFEQEEDKIVSASFMDTGGATNENLSMDQTTTIRNAPTETIKTASRRRASHKRPSLTQQQQQTDSSNMKAVSNIH